MSKLTEGERIHRLKMFEQGLLWCTGHQCFEPIERFYRYCEDSRLKRFGNFGYRYRCSEYESVIYQKYKDGIQKKFKKRNGNLKQKWVDLAGGECQRCGFSVSSGLEFHHVYPVTKSGLPSVLIFRNDTEAIWKELDKCCLLCSNCHRSYRARAWQAEFLRRGDGLLGWTVGKPLPLDDRRYETQKTPQIKFTTPHLTASDGEVARQLTLFGA